MFEYTARDLVNGNLAHNKHMFFFECPECVLLLLLLALLPPLLVALLLLLLLCHPGDPSVLRFLIAAREEVESTQLRDDLLSMLVAGHETTGELTKFSRVLGWEWKGLGVEGLAAGVLVMLVA